MEWLLVLALLALGKRAPVRRTAKLPDGRTVVFEEFSDGRRVLTVDGRRVLDIKNAPPDLQAAFNELANKKGK